MTTITFTVNDEEYAQILAKRMNKTNKVAFLEAMGIDTEPDKVGRPTTDEVNARYQAFLEKCQQDHADEMRQQLHDKNEAMHKRIARDEG